MYAKQALRELGVGPTALSESQKEQIDEHGFFIVRDVLTPRDCDVMRAEFERIHATEKDQGGHEVHVEPGARRISNIFNKPTPSTNACGSPRCWRPRPICWARSRFMAPISATR